MKARLLTDPDRDIREVVLALLRKYNVPDEEIRADRKMLDLLGRADSTAWALDVEADLGFEVPDEDWEKVVTVQDTIDLLVKTYRSDLRNR
jgi:acyl carrier protein